MEVLYQLSYVGTALASYRRRIEGGDRLSTLGMTWVSVDARRVSSAMGAGWPELKRPEHPLECIVMADDVRNSNRVAAFLSWHFEDPDIKPPRAKAGRRRPHLITSACVREDVEGRLRGEYMTAALLLTLVVSAIDAATVADGRVGVIEDSGIVPTPGDLDAFGFSPGVGEPNGGWADRGYRERHHPV